MTHCNAQLAVSLLHPTAYLQTLSGQRPRVQIAEVGQIPLGNSNGHLRGQIEPQVRAALANPLYAARHQTEAARGVRQLLGRDRLVAWQVPDAGALFPGPGLRRCIAVQRPLVRWHHQGGGVTGVQKLRLYIAAGVGKDMGKKPSVPVQALLVQTQAQARARSRDAREKGLCLFGIGLGRRSVAADFRRIDAQQAYSAAIAKGQGIAIEDPRTGDALIAAIRGTLGGVAEDRARRQQ